MSEYRKKPNLLCGPLVLPTKSMLAVRPIREFLSEMIGTFILLIIGLCSHVVYMARGQPIDTFAAAFCFGAGTIISVSATLDVSGAHLNPAVTTAMASIGRLPWMKSFHYIAAQYCGAFLAAFVTWAIYYDALEKLDPAKNKTAHVYTTMPPPEVRLLSAFIDQIVSTGLLTFAIAAVDGCKTPRPFHPLILALVIAGIVVGFNYNAGAIINPARDLGPRLFISIAGYGLKVFEPMHGHYWWLIGVVAPHIGGIFGIWVYILAIDPDIVMERLIVPESSEKTASFQQMRNNQAENSLQVQQVPAFQTDSLNQTLLGSPANLTASTGLQARRTSSTTSLKEGEPLKK